MRFLADMGVSMRVVEWLRRQGHDTVHLRDESLQRLTDEKIFQKAISEQRIIVAFDLDFGEIAAFAADRAIGVILIRMRNPRTLNVIARLSTVLRDTSDALGRGAIVIVEDARHRVRLLPIQRSDE